MLEADGCMTDAAAAIVMLKLAECGHILFISRVSRRRRSRRHARLRRACDEAVLLSHIEIFSSAAARSPAQRHRRRRSSHVILLRETPGSLIHSRFAGETPEAKRAVC